MAGIDKIYGTHEQWCELFFWLGKNRPMYCRFLYPTPPPANSEIGPVACFPIYADKWLWKNCKLPWVRARLKDQYNGAPDRIRKR